VVPLGQVRLQDAEHRKRHGAAGQELADAWKPTREAGCLDAPAGLIFTEPEQFDAVTEEGREALLRMEPASVHLAEVRNDPSHDATAGDGKVVEFAEQIFVR